MPRLAMSLVVRDEIELISANVDFHAAQGVDTFFVVDNGSTDGTRERLEQLKRDYEMTVIDQSDTSFKQGEWATALAHMAREIGQADYIISNDADEFWFSKTGSLKDQCHERSPVISAPRYNMLPLSEEISVPGYPFYQSVLKVVGPIDIGPVTTDPRATVPMMLRKMPPKIMCSIHGLERVPLGNHTVSHAAGRPVATESLHVYHFPVRAFDQFTKRIEFARHQFALESPDLKNEKFRWHKRRWVSQMDAGLLRGEWESFLVDRERAAELQRHGVLRRDETIRKFFEPNLD